MAPVSGACVIGNLLLYLKQCCGDGKWNLVKVELLACVYSHLG